MPNIPEYESKSTLTPSDKGISAAEDAARMYARTGEEIGRDIGGGLRKVGDAIERHMAVMETSELYKTGTELKLNLQTRYETESALPENRNDPHFGERFMAEVTPLIDQWGKGAGTDHGKQLAATLGGSIRNEIFNHVAAGQSEMDAAHVQDNLSQTVNSLGSGLITDPSEINLNRTIGTAKDAIQGMTMAIPDISTRERVASEMNARAIPQLVVARYNGVAESIKNQIAETGGETSPALEQLNKDVAAQLGFQYVSPEIQTRITKLGDEAVKQGQELFRSKDATAKAKQIEAGKAAYADIHNVATNLALTGQPPTPEIVTAVQEYARRFGPTNPGEAASLDDYILRGQDRAQAGKVQPYNQQVRDTIQTRLSLPKGDPRRPTGASLLREYSLGHITSDDLSMYTTIADKIDKPQSDPAFAPAHAAFTRWQSQIAQSIGNNGQPGTAVARAQFIHDSTVNFMAWGRNGGDWDKALTHVTDTHTSGNFTQVLPIYQKAARFPHAAEWFAQHAPQFNDSGSVTWPSGRAPNTPATPPGSPPVQPKKIDQKAVDQIRGL